MSPSALLTPAGGIEPAGGRRNRKNSPRGERLAKVRCKVLNFGFFSFCTAPALQKHGKGNQWSDRHLILGQEAGLLPLVASSMWTHCRRQCTPVDHKDGAGGGGLKRGQWCSCVVVRQVSMRPLGVTAWVGGWGCPGEGGRGLEEQHWHFAALQGAACPLGERVHHTHKHGCLYWTRLGWRNHFKCICTNSRPGSPNLENSFSSGERPIGATKGKQSDTKALCQPPPPPPLASPL